VIDSKFLIDTQFFIRNGTETEVLIPKKAQDKKKPTQLQYSLDILNKTEKVGFVDSHMNEYTLYVSAYTDQHSKVFEISDEPSKNIFETEKDRKLRE